MSPLSSAVHGCAASHQFSTTRFREVLSSACENTPSLTATSESHGRALWHKNILDALPFLHPFFPPSVFIIRLRPRRIQRPVGREYLTKPPCRSAHGRETMSLPLRFCVIRVPSRCANCVSILSPTQWPLETPVAATKTHERGGRVLPRRARLDPVLLEHIVFVQHDTPFRAGGSITLHNSTTHAMDTVVPHKKQHAFALTRPAGSIPVARPNIFQRSLYLRTFHHHRSSISVPASPRFAENKEFH